MNVVDNIRFIIEDAKEEKQLREKKVDKDGFYPESLDDVSNAASDDVITVAKVGGLTAITILAAVTGFFLVKCFKGVH